MQLAAEKKKTSTKRPHFTVDRWRRRTALHLITKARKFENAKLEEGGLAGRIVLEMDDLLQMGRLPLTRLLRSHPLPQAERVSAGVAFIWGETVFTGKLSRRGATGAGVLVSCCRTFVFS